MAEPYCLAMVLCDHVHRDATTNKCTVLGTFSSVYAPGYPTNIRFCVYFAITDGLGDSNIRIRLVESEEALTDDPQEIMCVESELAFEDPLVVAEGILGLGARLPHPGVYHCELYAGDSLLMSRRLLAIETPKSEIETQD